MVEIWTDNDIVSLVESYEFGLRMWTTEETDFLKQEYPKGDLSLLSCLFGRSVLALVHKASRIGVHCDG